MIQAAKLRGKLAGAGCLRRFYFALEAAKSKGLDAKKRTRAGKDRSRGRKQEQQSLVNYHLTVINYYLGVARDLLHPDETQLSKFLNDN